MKLSAFRVACAAAVLLAACGGADPQGQTATSETSADGSSSALASKPRVTLLVAPSTIGLSLTEGTTAEASLTVTYTGTNRRAVHLSVDAGAPAFAPAPVVTPMGRGRYGVRLATAPGLAAGAHTGNVTLRLCTESPCVNVASGALASVGYSVVVTPRPWPEWGTFQGNAAHTGYVPVTLDPAKFAKVWEWRRPTTGVLGFINPVVSEAGKVFVTEDEYSATTTSLYALNEADGTLAWQRSFTLAMRPALNPPAVSAGIVYTATTGHGDTYLWAFRASDGQPVFQAPFATQWGHLFAPTVAAGRVFTNGGYYGGGVYAYDAGTGAAQWSQFAGDDDMSTPALDGERAYIYSGTGLEVYAAGSGQRLASILDPYSPGQGYSQHGAPMLGSPDHVITFSGGAFSGRASSSVEQFGSRPLVNFSVAAAAARWRTAAAYLTQPATAKGVVYAGRNAPQSFDAIDEATGQVLWSWAGPTTDNEFHRNVVVTDNLVFVSTERAVYAIDLVTRVPVWSHPVPGMLAISAQGMLYIVEGAREGTGRLVAIRLK